jgi:phosphatidylglycerophosphate synthase
MLYFTNFGAVEPFFCEMELSNFLKLSVLVITLFVSLCFIKILVKKKFVINLIFLLFLNVLVKPFWIFGVERSVQNIVGASEFGFYFSLFNFSLLLNIVLDLGIINFNNRNISQNPQLLGKHLSNIVSLKFILAIVYALLTISAALLSVTT